MKEKNKTTTLTTIKTLELSFTRGDIQYYEARDGELIAYKGGYIHKLNFFEVDHKGRLLRSLYYDRSISRIFLSRNKKIIIERYRRNEEEKKKATDISEGWITNKSIIKNIRLYSDSRLDMCRMVVHIFDYEKIGDEIWK